MLDVLDRPPVIDDAADTPQVLALRARLDEVRRGTLRPPPKLTLPQWADEYRMLAAESAAEPGRWKTSRVAVARGPMEAVSDPAVHTVSAMCCTQLLKTELILNTIGYFVHQDPAPMIVMQPTVDLAEAFSKDRIAPMVRDTPVLTGKIADVKSRDSGNTILHKQFAGGHITMIGANAPGQLAMRPVRVVLCDEVDKYPATAGQEGDPIKLLSERSATFWNCKRIFTCSPTIEPTEHGGSRIAREYANSDQRIFEVDCPHCDHRHELQWLNVKWPPGEEEKAQYCCPECGVFWSEPERLRAIKKASERPLITPSRFGEFYEGYGWRGTQPFKGHAGFRASKLASPWETLGQLAVKFREAQASQLMLQTFINTQLAETWKVKGEAPEWKRLYERREQYAKGVVPMRALMLTAGADVQKDRIEVEVVAWGPRRESWSVEYRVFMGDTSSLDAPCWQELAAMLNEDWKHAGGLNMRLDRLGVDSGYNTQTVYNFVRKNGLGGRVMATKGDEVAPTLIGIPVAREAKVDGKRAKRGVKVWHIGLSIAKAELYGFLRLERPDEGMPLPDGWAHFPQHDEEYFKQLTAEQLVGRYDKRYGVMRYEWVKQRERNEVLDCRIIARAVASAFGLDRWTDKHWQERADYLHVATTPEQPAKQGEEQPEAEQNQESAQIITPKAAKERRKSSFW
ncbi:phage terminase large subunit family protein [Bradyrhizobium sp.]|uniref:phage terminase large subunit family protein n=1 Tax=Bradyrhizobium sp. TaxID=376 RepID=UPI0039E71406